MGIFGLFKPNVEKLKAKKDIRGLIKALEYKKDSKVPTKAAKALDDLVEESIQGLKDENWHVRDGSVWSLRWIRDKRAVEPLIQALKDEVVTVRLDVARTLGEIGDKRALEPLIYALKDENEFVQITAAEAIEMIRCEKNMLNTKNLENIRQMLLKR